jgi:hypothetical protein
MSFNTYSVKKKLKFYKSLDNDDVINIGITVSANHPINDDIYNKLNDFLKNLLIENYDTEEMYKSLKLHKDQEQQAIKNNEKYLLKQSKVKAIKTPKVKATITKSLY